MADQTHQHPSQEQECESLFQKKYDEFVDDLLGALPEYSAQIHASKELDGPVRLKRFQDQVKTGLNGDSDEFQKNPGTILPEVSIADQVWSSLSDNTKKAIWEHLRILSICSFMEGSDGAETPSWMDEAMNEMKKKLEGVDFQNIIKKFMTFFSKSDKDDAGDDVGDDADDADAKMPDFEKMFNKGFPKLPEKFLKGHMAKLAQEIVKDITPEDLGISPEMMKDCEKDPSRAFNILLSTFADNPSIIQKTVAKIGKRLQQKVQSGSIRPEEIAREAEELMKEFSSNSSFVEMMEGLKSAFGFEDMDTARKAGKEGSARLAMARDRLRKKLDKKKEAARDALKGNK
jgi:hypothetical protein